MADGTRTPRPMITKAKTSPYVTYLGSAVCNCMEYLRYKAVSLAAQSIYHDFDFSLDRKLQIGDLSPETGWCEGHPGASHGERVSMDVNYYTYKDKFATQYSSEEFRKGNIWTVPGEVLLPDIFDWERNFFLFARLCQIMPGTAVTVNDVLMAEMLDKAATKYGATVASIPKIGGDSGTTYNHHRHAHIELADADQSFRVSKFLPNKDLD